MGRPPLGKTAMSGAERVRRYREKHGTGKPVTKPVTKQANADKAAPASSQELAQARAEIARLRQELAAKPHQEPANSALLIWQSSANTHRAQRGNWTYFIRRGGRQFTVTISHGQNLPDKFVDMASLELAKAHCAEHAAHMGVTDAAEIARLRKRVSELEAEPPKPPKPQLDPESEAARQIKALKAKLHAMGDWNRSRADGSMNFATMSAIAKCLHPESRHNVTEKYKDDACKMFNSWKSARGKRR